MELMQRAHETEIKNIKTTSKHFLLEFFKEKSEQNNRQYQTDI